jgi:hypothetical protein
VSQFEQIDLPVMTMRNLGLSRSARASDANVFPAPIELKSTTIGGVLF